MSKWAKKTPEGLYRANSKVYGLAKIGNQNRTNNVNSAVWKFFSSLLHRWNEGMTMLLYIFITGIVKGSEGDKILIVLPFKPV